MMRPWQETFYTLVNPGSVADACESLKQRLEAMHKQIEAGRERGEREENLPPPIREEPRPPRRYDPDVVIAEFYDGGLPKARQEPPEVVEVIPEERSSWPPAGRGFVSRHSMRELRL
jgi:hypothetical protein